MGLRRLKTIYTAFTATFLSGNRCFSVKRSSARATTATRNSVPPTKTRTRSRMSRAKISRDFSGFSTTRKSFTLLVRVRCRRLLTINRKYSIYEAPLETWLSILKLANRWTFESVKELSVRELEKIEIEPVEKIAIYHDNIISRLYLIPSYIAVCKRDKPLTFSEGMKLGMETVLRVAEARERLRLQASESGIRTPTFEDFEDGEVEVLIREIFNLGIRPTSPNSATSPSSGANGTSNSTIKLNPAPPGNPPKANGAPAPRASGGLAADPKGSSVDSLPSFTSAIQSSQGPGTATKPPATPTPSTATQPTAPSTAQQRLQAPVPPTKPAQSTPPAPGPLPTDKPKDAKETAPQDTTSPLSALRTFMSGGAGEPSSSASRSVVSF